MAKNYKDGGLVSSDSNSASGAPTKKRIKVRGVGAATKGLKFYETQTMDYIKVCEHLLKKYRERRNHLEETLATGGVSDYAHYQRLVGEVTGLRICEQEIIDLRKNMEKADD